MGDILRESSVSEIPWALEANLQEHVSLYACLPGTMVCHEPGVVGPMTDLDVSESCVYRANFAPEEASRKIRQVFQRYRAQQCLPMWWIVGPSSQPTDKA